MTSDNPEWHYAPRKVDKDGHCEPPIEGEVPQFYSVYKRDQEGLTLWKADFHEEAHAKAFVAAQNGHVQVPTILVGVDGGLVQWASSDAPVNLTVLDMDVEGTDTYIEVPGTQLDGNVIECNAINFHVDSEPEWVSQVVTVVERELADLSPTP